MREYNTSQRDQQGSEELRSAVSAFFPFFFPFFFILHVRTRLFPARRVNPGFLSPGCSLLFRVRRTHTHAPSLAPLPAKHRAQPRTLKLRTRKIGPGRRVCSGLMSDFKRCEKHLGFSVTLASVPLAHSTDWEGRRRETNRKEMKEGGSSSTFS